jgi:SNF2 family DNA or RNA helicase
MELNGRLKNVMLRRLKSEVEDLPEKIRQVRHVALHSTEMATYRKKEQELWEKIAPLLYQIDMRKQQEILMALQTLKRYASLAKTPLTIEVLREVLEAGGKVVLFSEFLDSLNALQTVLQRESFATYRVDGSVTGQHRFDQVKGFQEYKGPAVFLGQIRAAGIGITLNSASTVVFNDFAWNSATHRQAEDRIHRIGQKETCIMIYVSAKDTIDEEIIQILLKKIDVISTVLDEHEDFAEILNDMRKKME